MGCARTSSGTTATTTVNCPAISGQVLLAGTFTVASTFFGAVSPTSSCANCAAGTANYYPDSGEVVPVASEKKAIGGVTCANLCLCSADGTCYTRTDANVNVVLYPYCDAGVCSTYAVIVAQSDSSGLVGTDGTTFTASQQIDPTTLDRTPVTDGNYPKITYASCSGCSTQTTC